MDTLHFLERVLPAEGNYCAAVAYRDGDRQGIRQRFFGSVKDLADFLFLVSERNNDVYYGVASFAEDGEGKLRRKQSHVHQLKLFALDIDVGKARNSYENRKDALLAVADFVERAKLPEPCIVSSGAGFHCYWVLDAAIDSASWQPVANALKSCWQSYGLNADPSVTADSARVLRPVGCLHTKTGRTVTMLRNAPDVTYEQMMDALANYYQVAPSQGQLPDYLKGRTGGVQLTAPAQELSLIHI